MATEETADGSGVSPEEWLKRVPMGAAVGPTSSGYTGVSEGYLPPQAKVDRLGFEFEKNGMFTVPRLRKTQKPISGIVTEKGEALPFYDLNTRPAEILASIDEVTRKKLTATLYARGWYGGNKPQGGLGDSDREAMRNLLYISNLQGIPWNNTLATMEQAPISDPAGGRVVQVASTEDLMEVANRTALSTIGRKLSDAEARKFSAAYQQAQRAEGYGSAEQAPDAGVFFQNRIEKKYGAESDSYKYLTAISKVANMLGGM
jgi:hypothetical protein